MPSVPIGHSPKTISSGRAYLLTVCDVMSVLSYLWVWEVGQIDIQRQGHGSILFSLVVRFLLPAPLRDNRQTSTKDSKKRAGFGG